MLIEQKVGQEECYYKYYERAAKEVCAEQITDFTYSNVYREKMDLYGSSEKVKLSGLQL